MGVGMDFPRQPDWAWLKATFPNDVLLRVDCPFIEVVGRVSGRMAYLATPYTRLVLDDDHCWNSGLSVDVEIRTARWIRHFAIEGATVVSPIVLACAVIHADMEGNIDPLDDRFWSRWCQPILQAAGSVIVPAIEGWDASLGVWREACWALQHNVPVFLVAAGSEYSEGAL